MDTGGNDKKYMQDLTNIAYQTPQKRTKLDGIGWESFISLPLSSVLLNLAVNTTILRTVRALLKRNG